MSAPIFCKLLLVSVFFSAVEPAAICGPGLYFSSFVGGCTPCKVNCDDQGNDAEACKTACVNTSTTKAMTSSTSDSTTEQPKEDVSTTSESTTEQQKEDVSTSDSTIQQQREDVSTRDVNKITATKTKPDNESTKGPKESDSSGLSDGQRAAIIVGIFVFIIVFVTTVVVYFWRFTPPSGANTKPGDEEEMCNEPSTSSGDASPKRKRLKKGEDKDETVAVEESKISPDFDPEDPYESRLHMQEIGLI